MTALEFDPDSVYKAQADLYKALIYINNYVERQLRNRPLPEMPGTVRGQVTSGIASAISTISASRVALAGLAQEIKNKTYDLVEHDSTQLGWGWKVGDFAFQTLPSWTGTDIIYKAMNPDQFSKKDVAMSAVSFATNFIPIGKTFRFVGKGGRGVIRVLRPAAFAERATAKEAERKLIQAQIDAQIERAARAGSTPVNMDGLGPRVFHTGGAWRLPAGMTAQDVADRLGGHTIESTPFGQWLESLNLHEAAPGLAAGAWDNASVHYAATATGTLRVALGNDAVATGAFIRKELPALLDNHNITGITLLPAGTNASRAISTITVHRGDSTSVAKALEAIGAAREVGQPIRLVFK